MKIDGNAARAARRERLGEPIEYTLGATTVTFPVELPLSVTDVVAQAIEEKWEDGRYYRALFADILGDEQWQALWAEKPSAGDLHDLWQSLQDAYAADQGESSSSPNSSATGGESSKPKSGRSTKRTRSPSVSAA